MNFDIPIEIGAVKLVAMLCRIGAFVFAFPFFSAEVISMKYKMLLTVALAFAMLPCIGDVWSLDGSGAVFRGITVMGMLSIVISEAMLGLAISLFVLAAIDILSYGGSVMDMDIGFSASTIFDPSGETRTIFAYLMVQLFVVAFLVGDMHLEMIRILASSFQTLAPGAFFIDGSLVGMMIRAVNSIFLVGIQVALPIMAAMFMINLGMAVLARIGEDFPVMILSFAIHIGVGIVIFKAILPSMLELCRDVNAKLMEALLYMITEV